ncbi:MAG TPA: class I SAM-dependent methyltransferase [Persephonella sp.]|nr:class I SAM-dependent methyltransferase [Persephonella sp.]
MMDIGKRFDQVANRYDTPDKFERSKIFVENILSQIPVKNDFKVLDVGAGTGTVDILLSPYVKEIHAYDLSEGMLSVFSEKIRREGIKNIKIFREDILNKDGDHTDFDLVITSMTLHHIEDTYKAVKKLSDFLKVGGYLVVVDLEKEDGTFHSDNTDVKHFGFDREEIESMFRSAGLQDINVQTVFTIDKEREGKIRKYPVFMAYGRKSI